MSEFGRLSGVFLDPKPAFADIATHPRWWVPVVLLVVVVLGYMLAFSRHVGWQHFLRQAMDASPRTQNLSAAEREQAIQIQARFAPIFGTAGAAIVAPVTVLAEAAVLLLIFNGILGAMLRFEQAFALTCYASLVGVLKTAVGILVMFLKNPEDFDLRNPVASHLGALLDPQTTSKWLVSIGTSLDLFTIWTVLLLATGFSIAARKVTWGKSLLAAMVPWIGWTAIMSARAAIFS